MKIYLTRDSEKHEKKFTDGVPRISIWRDRPPWDSEHGYWRIRRIKIGNKMQSDNDSLIEDSTFVNKKILPLIPNLDLLPPESIFEIPKQGIDLIYVGKNKVSDIKRFNHNDYTEGRINVIKELWEMYEKRKVSDEGIDGEYNVEIMWAVHKYLKIARLRYKIQDKMTETK